MSPSVSGTKGLKHVRNINSIVFASVTPNASSVICEVEIWREGEINVAYPGKNFNLNMLETRSRFEV